MSDQLTSRSPTLRPVTTIIHPHGPPHFSSPLLPHLLLSIFLQPIGSNLLNEREDGSLRYGALREIVCGVVGSELRGNFFSF